MAKQPSEAQLAARKKFAEASRARAAARKAGKEEQVPPVDPVDPGNPKDPEVEDLKRMVTELKAMVLDKQMAEKNGSDAVLTDRGIVGTHERYIMDPAQYPDPRERLASEQRLTHLAFDLNFELEYGCHSTRRYQTIDGRWQVEPQFDLELIRKVRDENTGELTPGRYTVCKGIFFEDPDSAVAVANEQGLPVDDSNQKEFLDEMRYIRMRDWLMDAFFYPVDTSPQKKKRDMVIDGRQVQYWEVSGEESQAIPFGQLRNKLKT